MLLAVSALGTCLTAIADDEQVETWYQVDVILFKPRTTNLDEESWPEFEPAYPVNVHAITQPAPFKLSQLEQIEDLPTTRDDSLSNLPGGDEFVFESRSMRERNRQVIESLSASASEDQEEAESEKPNPIVSTEATQDGTEGIPPQMTVDYTALLPEADPYSAGSLAFSSTHEDSSLFDIQRSLRRSSRFDVLGHYSWMQPINSEPTPVMMQSGQRYDDRFEVEGTLSFSRSRFLHVEADLWYTIFESRGGSASRVPTEVETTLDNETLKSYKNLLEVERQRGLYFPARVHKMMQTRRMRSDELHYLDHPLFGVIVRINRRSLETETAVQE